MSSSWELSGDLRFEWYPGGQQEVVLVFDVRVFSEEMVDEEICEMDGVMNEGDESPTTTNAGVIAAGVMKSLLCENN